MTLHVLAQCACASSEHIITLHMPVQTWVYVCGDGRYACASSEARWNVRRGYSDLCACVMLVASGGVARSCMSVHGVCVGGGGYEVPPPCRV